LTKILNHQFTLFEIGKWHKDYTSFSIFKTFKH